MPSRSFVRRFWSAQSDTSLSFHALRRYLGRLDYRERVRGSHHIFTREGAEEIINLQPQGTKCKAYQVRQVRKILIRHGLR